MRDGKKLRLIMLPRAAPWQGSERTLRATLRRRSYSSAPIGWPPGRCARTWYIQKILDRQKNERYPKGDGAVRLDRPAQVLGILVDL